MMLACDTLLCTVCFERSPVSSEEQKPVEAKNLGRGLAKLAER